MKRYFHPLILPIYAVLFLYSHNVGHIGFRHVVLPLIAVAVLSVAVYGLSTKALHDQRRAALITSCFWVLFFSFGRVHAIITGTRIFLPDAGHYYSLLLLWIVIFVVLSLLITRTTRNLAIVNRFFNIASAALMVIVLASLAMSTVFTHMQASQHAEVAPEPEPVQLQLPQQPRDIYYIILDGYPSSDTLKKVYGYDNSYFIDGLREMGFFIADESRSNYPLTVLSLSSSLNMRYLDEMPKTPGDDSRQTAVTHRLIEENTVARSLQQAGYNFVHFNSGWGPTIYSREADENFLCGRVGDEFTEALINLTPLMPALGGDGARRRILCTFSTLPQVPQKVEGPRFTFAHMLPPHPPYLFDRDGEPLGRSEMQMTGDVWKNREAYLEQLRFVNQQVLKMVSKTLQTDGPSPIVVIQADHGTASLGERITGGWSDPEEDFLRERSSILNAYLLPDNVEENLYSSITPVNTFRLLFRHHFLADMDLIEDRVYFSCYERPFDFREITDLLKEEEEGAKD